MKAPVPSISMTRVTATTKGEFRPKRRLKTCRMTGAVRYAVLKKSFLKNWTINYGILVSSFLEIDQSRADGRGFSIFHMLDKHRCFDALIPKISICTSYLFINEHQH
jgi:hypothetical protein